MDRDDLILKDILEGLENVYPPHVFDIPDADMYMDRVIRVLDRLLAGKGKLSEGSNAVTKTMINNYAKNRLLPSPVDKKYGREHVIFIIFICYFKSVMSMEEIRAVLTPLADIYFGKKHGTTVSDIFESASKKGFRMRDELKEQIEKGSYPESLKAVSGGGEDEFLRRFSVICELSYEIYIRRKMLDELIKGIMS